MALVRELATLAGIAFPERTLTPEEQARARQWETRRAGLEAVTTYAQQVLWSSQGEERERICAPAASTMPPYAC